MPIDTQLSPGELDSLTTVQKLTLIDQLWASVADDEHSPAEELLSEMSRRGRALDAQPDRAIPWSTLRAELRGP